jgi:Cellulose binding domain
MPRHRKDCGPRHGTLRREGGSRRSVLPRGPGLGPAFGRDVGRPLVAPERRPRLRLVRSLLATPWFAAGAGIVIAAVLAVDSPAALTYGPTFPIQRCPVHGCGSAPGRQSGQPATATPGVALGAPGMQMKGGATAPQGRRGRGRLLGYQIVRQWSSGFLALITFPRAAKPGGWSLHFAFAAAHVDHVWGARWRPSGNGDGGTAYGPLQWPGHPRDDGGRDAGQVMLSATGAPQAPTGCALDGASCRFSWRSPVHG